MSDNTGVSDFVDDQAPTNNPPWPSVDPFRQARFERRYLEDGVTIDFSSLPSHPSRVLLILKKVEGYSIGAGRRLTMTEANAIAEDEAHATRFMEWSLPGITISSGFLAWRGRHTYRFPAYTPNTKWFDPYIFPSRRLPLLRGRMALVQWHLLRAAAYVPFVFLPVTAFFSYMTMVSSKAYTLRDPRLRSLNRQMTLRQSEMLKSSGRGPGRRPDVPNPADTALPPNQQQMGHESSQDSASQYYGGDGYDYHADSASESSGTVPRASQTTRPSWGRGNPAQSAPEKPQNSTGPDSGSRYEDDLFDTLDEDNSPVAPSARRDGTRSSGSSGSAWDRIRRQANSGSSTWEQGDSSGQERGWARLRQDKARTPKDATPKTDSFSYTNKDEEKEKKFYEKEEAQKDFDALVEAERQGESVGSSSSSRGWRK